MTAHAPVAAAGHEPAAEAPHPAPAAPHGAPAGGHDAPNKGKILTRMATAPFRLLGWAGTKIYNGVREGVSRVLKFPLAVAGADVDHLGNPLDKLYSIADATRKRLVGVLGYPLSIPQNIVSGLKVLTTGHGIGTGGNGGATPAAAH